MQLFSRSWLRLCLKRLKFSCWSLMDAPWPKFRVSSVWRQVNPFGADEGSLVKFSVKREHGSRMPSLSFNCLRWCSWYVLHQYKPDSGSPYKALSTLNTMFLGKPISGGGSRKIVRARRRLRICLRNIAQEEHEFVVWRGVAYHYADRDPKYHRCIS